MQCREETQRLERARVQALEENMRQLRRVNQQLEESEKVVTNFERRVSELEQLSQKDHAAATADRTSKCKQQSRKYRTSIKGITIKLGWREGGSAACCVSRTTSNAMMKTAWHTSCLERSIRHVYNMPMTLPALTGHQLRTVHLVM